MAEMAAAFYGYPQREMMMLGVTGTNGKTTTTYMVKSIAEKAGKKVGLIGTIRNMIGEESLQTDRTTPESTDLFRILRKMADARCDLVIMEVSSHSLAQYRVHGIRFDVALFTNLSQDHLDYHKTMDAYLQAKAKLFDLCGLGIVNMDDPASAYILEHTSSAKLTISARDDRAQLVARNVRFGQTGGVSFEALMTNSIARVSLETPAMFTVYNALAAIGCVMALNISLQDAVSALNGMPGVDGRMQPVQIDADFRVIVDYAHSPESVRQTVEAVRAFTGGRVISVFGCGGNRDKTKRPKMAAAAAAGSDYVIVTTDNPRFEEPEAIIDDIMPGLADAACPYERITDRQQAISRALELAKAGDTVLIMGKGHETYQEICGVRHHFDDREAVVTGYRALKGAAK